jgi:hypothetical protein
MTRSSLARCSVTLPFKLLLDSGQPLIDELCDRFLSFYGFDQILENLAAAIQSGALADFG